MGIWDDLMERLRQTREAAQREAARRASQAAIEQVKKRVSDATDDFLDAAEKELQEAQSARAGQTAYTPSAESSTADDIIQKSRQAEDAWRQRQSRPAPTPASEPAAPPPTLSPTEQKAARRARAAAELAALKQRRGGNSSADDSEDDDTPDRR